MKRLIIPLILVLLAPLTTPAALLFYKGAQTENYFGANNQERRAWKIVLIIDYDTGTFARTLYGTLHGTKRYFTTHYTNSHIVQVTGLKGKLQTALTRIPSDCQVQESPGKEAIYFAGPNATLTINTGTALSFARTLTDTGSNLSHTTPSNLPYIVQGTVLLVFKQSDTIASNQDGETLDAAIARIETQLQSQGFSP